MPGIQKKGPEKVGLDFTQTSRKPSTLPYKPWLKSHCLAKVPSQAIPELFEVGLCVQRARGVSRRFAELGVESYKGLGEMLNT